MNGSSTLTTQYGVKFNITYYNGKVAFEHDQLTVLWVASQQSYVLVDRLFRPLRYGALQECLDAVRLSKSN